MSVQSRSDGVNTSLFEKREHIEKLHRTRNLLRKVQVCNESLLLAHFIYCIMLFAMLSPNYYNSGMLLAIVNLLKLIFVKKSSSSMIYLQDCKNVSSQKPMAMLLGSILEQCQFSRFIICPKINFPFVIVPFRVIGAIFCLNIYMWRYIYIYIYFGSTWRYV